MLSHDRIWTAIDTLAERNGLTASGLARRAGLDPTSFNKSKRHGADGRDRWPSTESLSKVLGATGSSLDEFIGLIDKTASAGNGSALPDGSAALVQELGGPLGSESATHFAEEDQGLF